MDAIYVIIAGVCGAIIFFLLWKLAEQKAEEKHMEERTRLEQEISAHLKDKNLPVHIHGNTVDIGDVTFSLDDVLARIKLD